MPNQDSDKKSNFPKDVRKQKPAYILTNEGIKKLEQVFLKLFGKKDPSNAQLKEVVSLDKSTINKILSPHQKKGVNKGTLDVFFERLLNHYQIKIENNNKLKDSEKKELDELNELIKFIENNECELLNRETENSTTKGGKDANEKTPILSNNKDNLVAVNKDLNKYLLSLNCYEQKKQFQDKINCQVGFFIIKSDIRISPWLRCVLEQKIGGLNTATKIPIKLAHAERQDFDSNFPQKFKHVINTADNISIEMLVTKLAELYQQKTVIIYIYSNHSFTFDQLKKLSKFYSQLVKKTSHTRKQHKQVNKPIYFILFLIDELKTNINNQKIKNINLLNLSQISCNEVKKWLIYLQNKSESQKVLNIDNETFRQAMKIETEPYTVIDEICKNVFKLNEGIEDIQNSWKLEQS